MKKIGIYLTALTIAFLSLSTVVATSTYALSQPSYFADSDLNDAQNGLQQVGGGGESIGSIIATIISVISYVVGVAAVIMLIVGAMKFITSGGDTNKVSSARSTIVNALIGLVIAVLAQVIIHFVVSIGTNTCPSDSSIAANDKNCKIAQ